MKRWDVPVLTVILLLSLLPLAFFRRDENNARICVACRGETVYDGPLSRDAVIVTPDGQNEITVKSGRAYMTRAACPDGLCLSAGAASIAKPIVCLPNEVTVTIHARAEDTDASTY